MLTDWLLQRLAPGLNHDCTPDESHPHRRRFTAKYRRKQGIVKNIWIGSGLVMLAQATPAVVIGLALGTTFLSFVILDETG